MYVISEEERVAIRDAYNNHGEEAGIRELLRIIPAFKDDKNLLSHVQTIVMMASAETIERNVAALKEERRQARLAKKKK